MDALGSEMPHASGAPVAEWFDVNYLYGDPLDIARRMRQEGKRIAFVPMRDAHFTASSAVSRGVLSDTANWRKPRGRIPLIEVIGPNLMYKEDPEHAEERAAINPSLRPKTVKEVWTPTFRRHAERLVDDLIAWGPGVDFNECFAIPYAALNLAAVTGLHEAAWQDITRWSHAFIAAAQNQLHDPTLWGAVAEAQRGVDAAIDVAIERVKREPDSSMLSAVVNGPREFPIEVIRGMQRLAVAGGMNEPQHTLLHGLWAFDRHPVQKARLLADPSQFGQAFDEVLRWLPPITMTSREALHQVTVDGVRFEPGNLMLILISGANRDPEEWEDPDSFNVFRERRPHFAFGGGVHLCAGIWTSRAQAEVAWATLFQRLQGLRIVDPDAVEFVGFTYRGIQRLPVAWDSAGSAA